MMKRMMIIQLKFMPLLSLLCAIFILITPDTHAQIPSGTLRIAPSVSFNHFTYEHNIYIDYASTKVKAGAGIDYFIINNLGIGLNMGLEVVSTRDLESHRQQHINYDKNYYIGPEVNYYIPISSGLYLALGAMVNYVSIDSDYGNSDLSFLYSGVNYGMEAGIHYLFNEHIGAFLSFRKSFMRLQDKINPDNSELKRNQFDTLLGVEIFL